MAELADIILILSIELLGYIIIAHLLIAISKKNGLARLKLV